MNQARTAAGGWSRLSREEKQRRLAELRREQQAQVRVEARRLPTP